MTTPARYCCTLQQSKRLRELGVDAPSMFYHYKVGIDQWSIAYSKGLGEDTYPAYTVGELGEMLPYRIWVGDKMYVQTIIKVDSSWHKAGYNTKGSYWYQYEHLNSDRLLEVLGNYQKEFPTQAQSAADMLIHLLENNLITADQVNNQLK